MKGEIMKNNPKANAAVRIFNYLDWHNIEVKDFARAIGHSAGAVSNFVNRDRLDQLGSPALHECAKVMNITFDKLVSPIGPEYYEENKQWMIL